MALAIVYGCDEIRSSGILKRKIKLFIICFFPSKMEPKPLIDKNILLEIIWWATEDAISLKDIVSRVAKYQRSYCILVGNKIPEKDSEPFIIRALWQLVLRRFNAILRLDSFFKMDSLDYSRLFEPRDHEELMLEATWNKYRILWKYKNLWLIENNGAYHKLFEVMEYSFSGRYFVLRRKNKWFLYQDEPWHPDKYLMEFEFPEKETMPNFFPNRRSVSLIETTIGLLLIIGNENKVLIRLNVKKKTVENVVPPPIGAHFPNAVYCSGGIFLEYKFYKYTDGNKYTENVSPPRESVVICHPTGVLGIDIIEVPLPYKSASCVCLFNGIENKVIASRKYDTNYVTNWNKVCFAFDTFIGFRFGGGDLTSRIVDLLGEIIMCQVTPKSIIGMTRRDDGTGYYVWLQ